MAMRAAATATAATAAATSGRGLRAMFSSLSSFPFNIPQTNVEKPPPAEPSTNLFVSETNHMWLVFPENIYDNFQRGAEELPNLPFFAGSIELMAVPKKKVSRHKKGIRNGPKALKPVPVIVRCKVCGRVKLPHFFCCSGIKPSPGDQCE